MDITSTKASTEVVEALYDASDHLPVTMKIAVDAKLSVADNDLPALQASIAPNPATSVATVFFNNPKTGKVLFDIYSVQGQLVKSGTGWFSEGESQFELSIGDLAEGFYLLRIENEFGFYETLKLLKF